MANLTKGTCLPAHITALDNPDSSLYTAPKDINKTLENFYTKLYDQEPIDFKEASSWLDSTTLPHINPDHLQKLKAPIAEEEISIAFRGLSNGKLPGPDGYTPEFYKMIREEITPSILLVCNSIWDGGPYLTTGHQANVKLIAKRGKDPGS